MPSPTPAHPYSRKMAPWERMLNLSPFSVVAMLIRLKGNLTKGELAPAVQKLQQRHYLLQAKITWDGPTPTFTNQNVGEILVKAHTLGASETWVDVYDAECRIPFDFDQSPAIRFVLIKSPDFAEILIFCHHVICDGKSLAFLARDLLEFLGDPSKTPEFLGYPAPIAQESLPSEVSLGGFLQKIMAKINMKWDLERTTFDLDDYRTLVEAYWKKFTHDMIAIELSEAQTARLVTKCREEKVTVNSALATAFAGAQLEVQGKHSYHPTIGVAGDMRSRLPEPLGEVMGFYAGVVEVKYTYNLKKGFWENARHFHRKIGPKYTNKNLFSDVLKFEYLNPEIMESRFFKILGDFVQPGSTRYEKLSTFAQRDDLVLSLLKRSHVDTVDYTVMGTAITNLTRMDFPKRYGELELDRLIFQPGGAYVLSTVNLVMGIVTCAAKMSILMEFAKRVYSKATAEKIKVKALQLLGSPVLDEMHIL